MSTFQRKFNLLFKSLPIALALLLPISAMANEETMEELVVTGSRISADPNVTNPSPVTQVGADEFLYQGVTRVEDLLNDLPSVYPGQESGQSNGATGTATVNLRNLGTERTLILIDGHRMGQGSPIADGITADINQIPASLVERVEVLTGGASSAYGSDAVAGVINFILKDDFEGINFDYQKSYYSHDNSNSDIQSLVRSYDFAVPCRQLRLWRFVHPAAGAHHRLRLCRSP